MKESSVSLKNTFYGSVKKIRHFFEWDEFSSGNTIQSSRDASYLARHVALRIGLPHSIPAVTINRLCGSGFQSIIDACLVIF